MALTRHIPFAAGFPLLPRSRVKETIRNWAKSAPDNGYQVQLPGLETRILLLSQAFITEWSFPQATKGHLTIPLWYFGPGTYPAILAALQQPASDIPVVCLTRHRQAEALLTSQAAYVWWRDTKPMLTFK